MNVINEEIYSTSKSTLMDGLEFADLENNGVSTNSQNMLCSTNEANIINSTANFSLMEDLDFEQILNCDRVSNIVQIDSSNNNDSNIIDISSNTNEVIEEYKVIRKKIELGNIKHFALENREEDLIVNKMHKRYELVFSSLEAEFILKKINKPDVTKFIYDILKIKISLTAITCYINFTSHGWNKTKTILRIYSRCVYFREGCKSYKFVLHFTKNSIRVEVFEENKDIKHPLQNLEIPQFRGLRRDIAKHNLKKEFPSVWRDDLLYNSKKQNKVVWNVPTKEVARKIKSEHKRSLDRSQQQFWDLFLMRSEKGWDTFIQRISTPQTIYLYSYKTLSLASDIMKYSRNTIFFDGTGSVVKQWDKESKRVFLYSLIIHVKLNENEPGILLPIAESFLSSHYADDIFWFLDDIRSYCSRNKLKWPFAKRVCVDFSWALINSAIKVFNCYNNIHTIEDYLNECFNTLKKNENKISFTCIQICCAHMCRIIDKDIGKTHSEIVLKFLKNQFFFALNLSDPHIFWEWLELMFTLLLNRFITKSMQLAKQKLKNLVRYSIYEDTQYKKEEDFIEDTRNSSDTKIHFKNSPFYVKGFNIFQSVIEKIDDPKIVSEGFNKFYNKELANVLLKKYTSYCPFWTNLIGKFAENRQNTRVSNSPVESQYNIIKNYNLHGERYIRANEYIRISYKYIQAKIAEIEFLISSGSPIRRKRKKTSKLPPLLEDKWKRTPKKVKRNKNTAMLYSEKVLRRIPKSIEGKAYHFLNFKHIFEKNYGSQLKSIHCFEILLNEYLNLNPPNELYNNVVDIYINVLISECKLAAYSLTTEEGRLYFYSSQRTNIEITLEKYDRIIVPIHYRSHFTVVFLDVTNKEFSFIDPLEGTSRDTNKLFSIFKEKTGIEGWKVKNYLHDKQTDSYSCGVHILQFSECFLKNKDMVNLEEPDIYRECVKSKLLNCTLDMKDICLHCGGKINTFEIKCRQCSRYVCTGCLEYYYKNIKSEECIFCKV